MSDSPARNGKRVVIATRSFASTDREPLALLERAGIDVVRPATPPQGQALAELLVHADGLIIGSIPLTAAHFAVAPRLRVVAMHGVGVDHIDLAAAAAHTVTVTNAPGSNDGAVADLTIALMLACLRQIPAADSAARAGVWRGLVGDELEGKTVGLIGMGRIGRGVVRRLRGFEVTLLAYDPYVDDAAMTSDGAQPTSFDDLLTRSDIVSLHLPLTAETSNLLDAINLAKLRPSAYLINTARGGIVDEEALAQRLRAGLLRGAGLDCFAVEPPVGNPLLDLSSVVVTPHTGSQTREAITRMGVIASTNVIRVLAGQDPLYRVA